MRTVSNFIVEKSKVILAVLVLLALCCVWLMTHVDVNSDMSKYLPADSRVRAGADIMEREFPAASSANFMFGGLSDEEKTRVASELAEFEAVTGVIYEPDSERHNKDGYALYTVTFDLQGSTPESIAAVGEIEEQYAGYDLTVSGDAAGNTAIDIVAKIAGIAMVIMLAILFAVCDSWVTPFVLLLSIAAAVALNMGTNIFLGEVSEITNQIAAILQLCLSMDYSIMLLDRYRQAKTALRAGDETSASTPGESPEKQMRATAMKTALRGAFAAISSSSVTTIAGMLALVFMSFTIGRDMGLVLAKGVFLSLVCIFTVLPALILIFDGLIEKTGKKALHIKTDGLAAFSFRARRVIPFVFVALFVASFLLKGGAGITYTISEYDKIGGVFELDNQIVVLYENRDEELVAPLAEKWAEHESADAANGYASSLGRALTAAEASEALGMEAPLVTQLYALYSMSHGAAEGGGIPLYDFMRFVVDDVSTNEAYKPFFTEDAAAMLSGAEAALEDAKRQFVGPTHSRIIISSHFKEESPETFAFLAGIESDLSALSGEYYIVGASAMAYEMSRDFPSEMNFITLLTVIAIFAVVAVAFRSLSVPLILVCVVQCAVFITMGLAYFQGSPMYYLPLLIVQCLLLGSTVDYGILLTSCYIEARREMGAREALADALRRSIHTIMTSALILVLITGIIGIILAVSDRAISEILMTIAKGGVCAAALTTLILPGLLAAFDRFLIRRLK
ncbi:MAG: MMPL family transporter [Oscillospiraceae bacterium]|jgi:predicted RND superfamily exporter protein|nr:MMPL family transporter [Oscillospiraceae bacterium]